MEQAIKSLVWATDVDVLGPDHTVARRDGYWAVHSPSNPTYWWGNLLLFDDAPGPGDGERWARLFAAEFARDLRELGFSARPLGAYQSSLSDYADG